MSDTPQKRHQILTGLLWILSPFIILFAMIVVSFAFGKLNSPVVNVITILGGMIGVVLLFVGPIVGVTKLAKRNR